MGKCPSIMLLLFLHSALGLFKEQELDVLRYYKPPYYPVDLRHIYYVGTIDNGTLDCNMNGAVKFHWWKISKEEISEGGFVFSWKEALKIPDPEKPWLIEIDSKNFQTNSAVILCRGINGYKADILAERGWIITRIHSPLGYPTEPTICGGEKYDCATLKPLFRIECMHDYGSEYAGSMSKTKSGEECQSWNTYYYHVKPLGKLHDKKYLGHHRNKDYFLSRGRHAHLKSHKYKGLWGEHNYCRSFVFDWSTKNLVRPPECLKASAPNVFKERIPKMITEMEECDVPSCSPCMYGDGNGKLAPYKHKLPVYNGTITETYHKYKGPSGKTMFRKCYMAHRDGHQFALWYRFNRCRTKHEFTFNIKRTSNRPSCLVWKKPGGFEKPNLDFNENNIKKYMVMARCRIRQCTVRTVWFLFFEGSRWVTIDQQSSREPRKFVFIEGQTVAIRYFIFGMHLRSGLKIVAVDKKKQRVVEEWKNVLNHVPKSSRILLQPAKAEYTGSYYFMYHFEEADPTIELGTYTQMFDIEVRKPLAISLSPLSLHICEQDEGEIRLNIDGGFEVLAKDIKWSYALNKDDNQTVMTLKTVFIKISADGRTAHVTQAAFISATVKWSYGTAIANASVFTTGKPLLQNVSPLLTIAFPGDIVKLALATDSPLNKLLWVHDAQEIEEVPDQPNMFFSKKETELGIIYILTIDKILKDQFGVYTVKAVNTKNCRHSMEFIVRQPAEEGDKKDKREERPTLFALTNSSLSKFKSIMDFMQSDCADILGRSKTQETNETDHKMLLNEDEKLNNKPVKILKTSGPYCISLQHSKPFFELDLVNLSRIKALQLFRLPRRESKDHDDNGGDDDDDGEDDEFRLMYSLDKCKWKIFGARRLHVAPQNISYDTNETSATPEPQKNVPRTLVDKLESLYESKSFPADGSVSWIGNTSLFFARYIRLVPTNRTISKKRIATYRTCIAIHLYGCPATIFDMPLRRDEKRKLGGIAGALAILVGAVLVVIGSWYTFKKWKIIMGLMKKCLKKLRSSLLIESLYEYSYGYYYNYGYDSSKKACHDYENEDGIDQYEYYYGSSTSDDSQEHIYWEIPDIQPVSNDTDEPSSTVANTTGPTVPETYSTTEGSSISKSEFASNVGVMTASNVATIASPSFEETLSDLTMASESDSNVGVMSASNVPTDASPSFEGTLPDFTMASEFDSNVGVISALNVATNASPSLEETLSDLTVAIASDSNVGSTSASNVATNASPSLEGTLSDLTRVNASDSNMDFTSASNVARDASPSFEQTLSDLTVESGFDSNVTTDASPSFEETLSDLTFASSSDSNVGIMSASNVVTNATPPFEQTLSDLAVESGSDSTVTAEATSNQAITTTSNLTSSSTVPNEVQDESG